MLVDIMLMTIKKFNAITKSLKRNLIRGTKSHGSPTRALAEECAS